MKRTMSLLLITVCLFVSQTSIAQSIDSGNMPSILCIGISDIDFSNNPSAEKIFALSYPNVKIEYRILREENFTQESGNKKSDIDLLIFDDNLLHDLENGGALYDLNLGLEPTDLVDTIIYEMLPRFEKKGRLPVLPRSLELLQWIWNTDIASKTNISIPAADWTWDDFLALAKKVENYNQANYYLTTGSDHELLANFLSDMIDQYITAYGNKNLDSPMFEQALSTFKQLYSSSALCSNKQYNESESLPDVICMYGGVGSCFNDEYANNQFAIPDPLISKDRPVRVGYFTYYGIPANAPNKELALEFLRLAYSAECQAYAEGPEKWFAKTTPQYTIEKSSENDHWLLHDDGYGYLYVSQPESYRIKRFEYGDRYDMHIHARSFAIPPVVLGWQGQYTSILSVLTLFLEGSMNEKDVAKALETIVQAESDKNL